MSKRYLDVCGGFFLGGGGGACTGTKKITPSLLDLQFFLTRFCTYTAPEESQEAELIRILNV